MKRGIHSKTWSVAWMGVSEGGAWKRGQGLIRSWVDGGGGGGSHCEEEGALALYLCQPTPTCAGRESLFPSDDAACCCQPKDKYRGRKKQTKKIVFLRIPSQRAKLRFL